MHSIGINSLNSVAPLCKCIFDVISFSNPKHPLLNYTDCRSIM